MIPLADMSRLAGQNFRAFIWFFYPPSRDEIFILAFAKRVYFSHATQLFSDFGVFLHLFARKSIASASYLTLLYSTNIKLGKKC